MIDTRSDNAHIVAKEESLYVTWWKTAKNKTRTHVFIASNDKRLSSSIEC
ncbi:MAG: hypothetical protein WBL67_15570 [Nitrososphaeraceae archaeon]